ncbi:MAG: hypothetical protein HXX81_02515 [Campylobacterales bacterium]|nr:hypothetical protein [Campylobacterales bacterium]
MNIKIPKPKQIIFFGGTAILYKLCLETLNLNIKPMVITAKRLLEESFFEFENKTLKELLLDKQIEFYECRDINSFSKLSQIVNSHTIGIGLGETYTFTKTTIALFNNNLFDFMTINLPKYRGGAHFSWQILRGSKIGAWNIQLINEEMIPAVYDSGAIIKTHQYIIPQSARIPKDYFEISDIECLKLFHEFINDIKNGIDFKLSFLQENFSSYFPRLFTPIHGAINWQQSMDEIERFINAFDEPYIGAWSYVNNQKVHLKSVLKDVSEGSFHPFMSGLIYKIDKNSLYVCVKDGTLIVNKVVNSNQEDIKKFLKVGERFFTPISDIEKALNFSCEYNDIGVLITI